MELTNKGGNAYNGFRKKLEGIGLRRRIGIILVMCCFFLALCACGERSDKYRPEIVAGEWIIPGEDGLRCEFLEDGTCWIDGKQYLWQFKKTLPKTIRVDVFMGKEKCYELQIFEAEEKGYRYMMNLGTPVGKTVEFTSENAGYVNRNHYEKVEITTENYETYFMLTPKGQEGQLYLECRPEYVGRLKTELSGVVFDVTYGQADFFLTCEKLTDRDGWGCVLSAEGIDHTETDPVLMVGQAKGVLYLDMGESSIFPVKTAEK